MDRIQELREQEQAAWDALTTHTDFTDKCKRRVYTGRRPYSPDPVQDIEARFRSLFRRWDAARRKLEMAIVQMAQASTSPKSNGSQPGESGNRPQPSNR